MGVVSFVHLAGRFFYRPRMGNGPISTSYSADVEADIDPLVWSDRPDKRPSRENRT